LDVSIIPKKLSVDSPILFFFWTEKRSNFLHLTSIGTTAQTRGFTVRTVPVRGVGPVHPPSGIEDLGTCRWLWYRLPADVVTTNHSVTGDMFVLGDPGAMVPVSPPPPHRWAPLAWCPSEEGTNPGEGTFSADSRNLRERRPRPAPGQRPLLVPGSNRDASQSQPQPPPCARHGRPPGPLAPRLPPPPLRRSATAACTSRPPRTSVPACAWPSSPWRGAWTARGVLGPGGGQNGAPASPGHDHSDHSHGHEDCDR